MTNINGLPSHVAIIPDGNRRWARERNLPTFEGHRRGFEAAEKTIQVAWEMGIPHVTLWGFSTENWNRDTKEIAYLMELFSQGVDRHIKLAKKQSARFTHLGRKDRIPELLRNKLIQAEDETRHFKERYLSVALDYGGKDEIIRAITSIISDGVDLQKLDPSTFEKYLDTRNLPQPCPDLIIRTGGEQRMSGFMSWQSGYSEMMFVKKYLPDFSVEDFSQCIADYQNRQRRFGK